MCGRYALYTETEDWSEAGIAWPLDDDFDWRASYNVAPTTAAPVVIHQGRPRVTLHRWGLVPHWAKDPEIGNRLINARSETLAEKPSFREAFRKRRCLVLADGFYEWKRQGKQKLPHYVRMKSRRPFAMAGLWENWSKDGGESFRTFTIVTTRPNDLLASIHDRMPVIVDPADYDRWLSPDAQDPGALSGLLAPRPAGEMIAHPVTRFVNSPANDSPRCIEPATGVTDG
jgi:putative SOS response-associated peptidase YedK